MGPCLLGGRVVGALLLPRDLYTERKIIMTIDLGFVACLSHRRSSVIAQFCLTSN